MSQKLFSELGLSPELLKAVEKMGFESASPIQSEAIPPLMEGRDMIGQSQTGSGKTAAFGIPAVECVDASVPEPQVLILCPTRELASQVAEEIAKLAAFKRGVRELPIYGGASYDRQFRGLKAGPQIIIGTPGRVLDHLGNGALRLGAIKMIVLDEADRMVDMGFKDELDQILEAMPETRQTVLFSATIPSHIQKMIERFTNDPVRVKIEATVMTIPSIEQSYVEVDYRSKTEVLCRLLDLHDVKYGIIFGFTKIQVDELTDALVARGYAADKLHGDMTQMMRERVMKRFREHKIDLLVATDVAARGLDVDDLEIVFNYELPHDPEDYVHRIGRTGRAGKSGKAITLVSGREYGRLQQVFRFTKNQFPRVKVPKVDELEQKHANRLVESVRSTLESKDYKPQDELVDSLLENSTPTEVISALLHMLAEEKVRPVERIKEDNLRTEYAERPQQPREQREPRAPRERREFAGDISPVNDQTGAWIRINVGRNAGVLPGDVVGCVAGESGLDRSVIGRIEILPTITLVQVAQEHSEQILHAIDGARLKSRRVSASPGQPPQPQGDRRPPFRPAGGGGGFRDRDEGGDRGGFNRGGFEERGNSNSGEGRGFGPPARTGNAGARRPFGSGFRPRPATPRPERDFED